MTLLVTGGAGYIGSHMVLVAQDAGHSVVVADNLSTGRRAAVPADVPLLVGDVGDTAFIQEALVRHNIRQIAHFAGSIVVPESVENPLSYYHNNTAASRTLIEAAVAAGVEVFLFSSTAAVYGDPAVIPVSEDAPPAPLSPYGSSKWMTEIMLADSARAYGLRYGILRYFNVAGADPKGRSGQASPPGKRATHLIKVACEAALGRRDHVAIYGDDYDTPDGTGVRDYIHVSDLAAAHLAVLEYLAAGGASVTLNCGYGDGFSVREVIAAVKRVSGVDFDVHTAPRRAGDSPKVVADIHRLQETINWQPRYAVLDVIVKTALDFERQQSA